MTSLEPLIAGRWNGHSLWMQWTPAEDATNGYRVEIAIMGHPDDVPEWKLIDAGVTRRAWMVLPIWNNGAMVRARVAVNGREGDPELARECVFKRSNCVFNFQAGAKPLVIQPQTTIHCAVDGAGASYVCAEWIDVEPGKMVQATLSSVASSGWAQLDKEGDFDIRPAAGARIWNAEPSTNDVEVTSRDYTVLSILARDGPLTIVHCPRNPNIR